MRAGFTLIECMLASAIIALATVAFFTANTVAVRISHEDSEFLAAEAVAWDATWRRFNEDYENLTNELITVVLTDRELPELGGYNQSPVLKMRVDSITGVPDMKCIQTDVEWGAAGNRHRVSDRQQVFIYRSKVTRVR